MALSPRKGAAVSAAVLPLCHEPAHAFRACRAGILKQMFVEAIMNILSFCRQHPCNSHAVSKEDLL